MAHPGGRPPKLTPEQRKEVFDALAEWIEITPDPLLVGFTSMSPVAVKYRINKDNLYDWEEFSELRKRAVEKQEYYLAYGATTGRLNASASIFRLKQPQIGYRDQQLVDHTTNGKDLPTPILGGISVKNGVPSNNSDPQTSEATEED